MYVHHLSLRICSTLIHTRSVSDNVRFVITFLYIISRFNVMKNSFSYKQTENGQKGTSPHYPLVLNARGAYNYGLLDEKQNLEILQQGIYCI